MTEAEKVAPITRRQKLIAQIKSHNRLVSL